MPRRFPLSAKIVLWFLLNLLLLAVLFIALLRAQFHPGPDWLLSRSANDRIDALSDIIVSELSQEPPAQWDATLNRFDSGYQNKVRFLAFDGRGQRLAGKAVELPDDVRHRLMEPRGPAPHGPPPFAEGSDRPPPARPVGPRPKFMMHTSDPSRYWLIAPALARRADLPRAEPLMLVIVSDSLGAGGLFFDVGPWIAFALAVLLLSVLLWFPLVRGINRSIAQMTAATRQIAAGRFDARVDERRRDELGALGQAINQMAARLAGLVAGQKRFLGDVAHELCSPLARLRVSLGILDQRADGVQKPYVASAEDEAAHIAELVNELLSFSRASLAASAAPLRAVNLLQVVEKIAGREAAGQALVRIEVPPELTAMADPELLARALANLLRNAVRYAGQAGAIFISAQRQGDEVRVAVSDCGPGVPAGELERIFDPFYRVDASRDRATGGVGLGLAIVKTCVEACGGTVACHNREPSGLEAVIRLRANADK
jgi:two-component system sensor histidine kinase CpxA